MKNNVTRVSSLIVALAAVGASAPSMAQVSAQGTIGVANMYLWRGLNNTPDGAQVQGGVKLSHDVGVYGGFWATTETGGHETDLYLGWAKAFGPFSIDLSYWIYLYPEDQTTESPSSAVPSFDMSDTTVADAVVAASYAINEAFSVGAAAYIQQDDFAGAAENADEDNYFTLTGTYKTVSLTYGWWSRETPATVANGLGAAEDEYSHIDVAWKATDGLSFAVSFKSSDLGTDDGGVDEDPLFKVAYDWSFDLMKM